MRKQKEVSESESSSDDEPVVKPDKSKRAKEATSVSESRRRKDVNKKR